mgnify:CR=1 FL=1
MTDYPIKLGPRKWIIQVQARDGNMEDLFIEIPPEALNQMGWSEGDVVEWFDYQDGSFIVSKVEPDREEV